MHIAFIKCTAFGGLNSKRGKCSNLLQSSRGKNIRVDAHTVGCPSVVTRANPGKQVIKETPTRERIRAARTEFRF